MTLLQIRFPPTNTKKPNISTEIAPAFTSSHWKFGRVAPAVTVTMIPIAQTMTVRVTSPIDRAKALMYFVTVTPQMLKVAIEKIPKMTKNSKAPLAPIQAKYLSGLSRKGIPPQLKTQASTPKLHGMKVMIGNRTISMAKPNIPSQPTTWSGSRWYLERSFCSKTNKKPFVNNERIISR